MKRITLTGQLCMVDLDYEQYDGLTYREIMTREMQGCPPSIVMNCHLNGEDIDVIVYANADDMDAWNKYAPDAEVEDVEHTSSAGDDGDQVFVAAEVFPED